ncbi:MAG TPA: tetratricopeptide repeat protein [Elusimicrobiales bacterium]|nr:tetratricopeptide repeat protein [Elusimicrobiales bacterium]
MKNSAILFSLVFLAGCHGYKFKEGETLEKQSRPLQAAASYESFAVHRPDDPNAAEAFYRAAGLYAGLGLCARSAPLYERLLRHYPAFDRREKAERGLFICPDYFPLDRAKNWKYGDSETGGRNATQLYTVTGRGKGWMKAEVVVYAGETLVQKDERRYELAETDLYEKKAGGATLLLSYPVESGRKWVTEEAGNRLLMRVDRTGVKVTVRGGEFQNCARLQRSIAGMSSWVYEYYAPGVGRVLTSVAGDDFENRVTELVSYEQEKD